LLFAFLSRNLVAVAGRFYSRNRASTPPSLFSRATLSPLLFTFLSCIRASTPPFDFSLSTPRYICSCQINNTVNNKIYLRGNLRCSTSDLFHKCFRFETSASRSSKCLLSTITGSSLFPVGSTYCPQYSSAGAS
jgi:hypothetical protein